MANIPIYGTLSNETPEGKLAVAEQIFDETENKKQSEINAETVRTSEQELTEDKKAQARKNIGCPARVIFNIDKPNQSGLSVGFDDFSVDAKNNVSFSGMAMGAMNTTVAPFSPVIGARNNVTGENWKEMSSTMNYAGFFLGYGLSDHSEGFVIDTCSALGYKNRISNRDEPGDKRVNSWLTIAVPHFQETELIGMNAMIFGHDDNLYIHGVGGFNGTTDGINENDKSLQEVLTDLDTRCPTAVEDGKTYGWKDGEWVELTAPAGGYNRALYEAAGAVFHEDTGFYDLNGLNDITEAQMDKIFAAGHPSVDFDCALSSSYNIPTNEIRTNLMPNDIWGTGNRKILNLKQAFIENFVIENACLGIINGSFGISAGTTMYYAFYNCKKLRRIVVTGRGRITETAILHVSNVNTFEGAFALCAELKDIKLYGIAYDISFKDSPNLTKESILFAIKNAALKTFTITLHATAYAMAMADEDIQAALAEKTNVSLASA